MGLRDDMPKIVKRYEDLVGNFHHNHSLIDILEGNLLGYVEQDLRAQLSPQSYEQCKHRIPPINVLTKIIDKMSTIYQPAPVRRLAEGSGTPGDSALLEWYLERMKVNASMHKGLELYNLCKAQLIQPFPHKLKPCLRAVPNDRFFVLSCDEVDPQHVTHVVTFDAREGGRVTFTAYTDTEFAIFDEQGKLDTTAMMAVENPEGINPYGSLPFVYSANARFSASPTQDTDILRMVKLLPLLMADLNYAVMFQSFCIMYGINVDDENLKMAPNAFWRFKSDSNSDAKPEIGVLKPQVDIGEVMGLIQSQLALWLNTRGIRPGAVGKLDADQFASGISKLIDEMDTVEIRRKLVDIESEAESAMWQLLMHRMHPVWVQRGLIENKALFSAGAKVEVVFSPQLPATSRGQIVTDQKSEVEAGFTTRRRAIKTLNPSMSDSEVDDLIDDIHAGDAPAAEPDAPAGDAEPAPGDAGPPASPDDAAAAAAAGGVSVQALALNGSQIDSLLTIVGQVAEGILPKDSARAILRASFPMLADDQLSSILDPIKEGGTPPKATPPPFGAKQPPPPPPPAGDEPPPDAAGDQAGAA